jgi:hypothetical protein
MGDLASTISTAADVASDPYLSEVFCRISQLKAIDHGEPVPVCGNTPAGAAGGVGLRNAIPVLRGYVYAQQNRWVYAVAVAAVLGLPMLIGYRLGQSHRGAS